MRMLRLFLAGTIILVLLGRTAGVVVAQSDEAGEAAFPTGSFVAEEDGLTLELHGDGTCERAGVPCTFGVRDGFFSEMTFEDPDGPQVPATYYWDFDGEWLTFRPWAPDRRPDRADVYAGHTFRLVEAGVPLVSPAGYGFPTGVFVPADEAEYGSLHLRNSGGYTASADRSGGWLGRYAVAGDLYTEMTHNYDRELADPVTYRWRWDGKRLTFSLWGEGENRRRAGAYGKVWVRDETPVAKSRILLSHPDLDSWVTIEVGQDADGRYEATAYNGEEPLGEGAGDTRQEAARAALESLGEPLASELAEHVPG